MHARTHARKRSILYQRGVYPPEAFESKKQYGLALWRTTEESLNKYLSSVLSQTKSGFRDTRNSRCMKGLHGR